MGQVAIALSAFVWRRSMEIVMPSTLATFISHRRRSHDAARSSALVRIAGLHEVGVLTNRWSS